MCDYELLGWRAHDLFWDRWPDEFPRAAELSGMRSTLAAERKAADGNVSALRSIKAGRKAARG